MLQIFLSVLIFIEWVIVCFAECWQLYVTWDQTLAWEFCEDCEYIHYNSVVKIFLLKFPHRITACYSINIIPSSLDPCPSNELCNMCFYHAVLQQCILYCTVLYHIHLVQWFLLYRTNIPLCWIPWQEALWRLDSGVYEGMYKLLCVPRHNIPPSLFHISVW